MGGLSLENAGEKMRKVKAVERLGTFEWNGVLVHDFLLKWMIFFLHILTKSMF